MNWWEFSSSGKSTDIMKVNTEDIERVTPQVDQDSVALLNIMI